MPYACCGRCWPWLLAACARRCRQSDCPGSKTPPMPTRVRCVGGCGPPVTTRPEPGRPRARSARRRRRTAPRGRPRARRSRLHSPKERHCGRKAMRSSGRRLPADALAALMRVVAGREFPPPLPRSRGLPSTCGPRPWPARGCFRPARLGPGMLLVREARAMQPPIPATPGRTWDGRFRLGGRGLPPDATLGAVGDEARLLRRVSRLPASVLETLPAIRSGGRLHAVPHVRYYQQPERACPLVLFSPPSPAACGLFRPG